VLASCFATRAAFAQAPIQAEPSTISVTEPRSPESLRERLTAEMARQMAGTFADPVTVVEDLPGVVRPWSESDGLAVWGARPSDSRVLVDGLEVPALLHLGSLRSAMGSIRRITST